jgi:radical SAM superfamily enzyme YgiQ (UPF0313 family)
LIVELKAVQARGARYVWFVDDNFRLGKRDIENVCRRILDEGIQLEWMTLIRSEVLKDADLSLLKQAGCREVQMGLESADQTMLERMNKQSDPELNEAVIERIMAAGIHCSCYFLFGYPGETKESVATTAAFIQRLEKHQGPGYFNWSLYPFLLAPFSPIYDSREESDLEGYLLEWSHETMDSEAVKKHLLSVYMMLDNSGQIYRDDNVQMFDELTDKNAFMIARHKLEKLKLSKQLDNDMAYKILSAVLKDS